MRVWDKTDRIAKAAYQCYSSVNTSSYESRKKKGLPVDGICQTPLIPEWRLQMMANYILRRYLSKKEKVLQLANSMLEANIGDMEEQADNAQLMEEKKSELARLSRKLDNYIEMRSDGEISKEVFRIKTDEIESAITQLQNEIADLERKAQIPPEIIDYEEKLAVLSYELEQYTNADENDVPESVIEAFAVKIVASKDGFDWNLRFDGDPNDPLHCTIRGKRKSNAQVSVSGTSSPAMHDSATGRNQEPQIVKTLKKGTAYAVPFLRV